MANSFFLRPLLLAAALTFATPAAAQDATENFNLAQGMIERAGVDDLFDPVNNDAFISVRHVASGMVCNFSRTDTRADIVTFNSPMPRGDDVGCVSDREDQATTLYATRYTPARSAEDALAEAVAAIRQRFTGATPTPTLLNVQTEGQPPLHAAHFFIDRNGERWITSALVVQSGPWIYKLRYTARAVEEADIMRHQLESSAILTLVLLRLNPGSPT